MTRHLLLPESNGLFTLQPDEGTESKSIKLPIGLNVVAEIEKLKDFAKYKDIISKISKTEIFCDENGFVNFRDVKLPVKYNKALVDSCNGIFLDEYEDFYILLRKYGISF